MVNPTAEDYTLYLIADGGVAFSGFTQIIFFLLDKKRLFRLVNQNPTSTKGQFPLIKTHPPGLGDGPTTGIPSLLFQLFWLDYHWLKKPACIDYRSRVKSQPLNSCLFQMW
jgi:hypothetical protein